MIAKQKAAPHAARMAVAAAGDEHTIEAVLHARKEGIIQPVLVGDKAAIDAALAHFDETVPDGDIYDGITVDELTPINKIILRYFGANTTWY